MRHPERLALVHLPTPLRRLSHLSREYGVELWVKRDDMTGMDWSGSTVRKLEFVLHDAIISESDMLLAAGRAGSNLCRAVAALGRTYRIETRLFLRRPVTGRLRGTLTALPGAKAVFLTRHEFERVEERLAEEADIWRRAGRRPYVIPMGVCTPLGACGYAAPWWRELYAQDGFRPDTVAVSVSSGVTMAGLLSGYPTVGYDGRVVGFSVSLAAPAAASRVASLCAGCESFGYPPVAAADITILDGANDFSPAPADDELLRYVAETEGLWLNPADTGKAFCALLREIRAGRLRGRILFVHTGGVFNLSHTRARHSVYSGSPSFIS